MSTPSFDFAIVGAGAAGVGGGATFAAVAVLTIMGLDITVVAILVSIENTCLTQ